MTKCTEKLQNGITTEYDYQYDKDGNRSKYVKTVNGVWEECYTYEYNAANQLISRTNERLWTDNVTYYTYDGNGNLISEKTGLFEKSYEYTAENRLAVVKAQGTVLMAALYDGDGNRLFTMDYTGENNDRWDIWIPECGGNADKVDDSAKDAMKELAGLVSWRDRKDYTITEYVNDVTRENEEVLAELNPRGKVTTAYTYGYSRESADVNGDTQYYLYDGKGNVDRISSEWGRVKETYNYDPYGNLTYGIPDTVNYYGYNGESSNLATGLHYLRARYYSPQTGNFITEDTYAGQTSNPLTLNRYTYTSNNPVNRIDPSGHSWVGDLVSGASKALKKAGDAIGTAVKKAATAVADTAQKVVNKVKEVAKDVVHAVTHPKETVQKAKQVVKETKQKADNFIQEAKKDPVKTFTTVAVKATKHVSEIKSAIKRAACTSANYIKEGLGKVDWASVGKAAAGVAIVAGLGVASVMTGGAAAVILGAAFTGAASGATIGAVAGGVAGMMSGEGFFVGAADGLLWGSIAGGVSGGVGQALSIGTTGAKILGNKWIQNGIQSATETVVDTIDYAYHSGDTSIGGIAAAATTSFAINFVTNGVSTPKLNQDESLTSLRELMTPEEIARYDEYWNNVGYQNAVKARDELIKITPDANKKAVVIGAYDIENGNVTAKFAGAIPESINVQLLQSADSIGGIGSKGVNGNNTVGVCAEFQAANELLNVGGNIENIRFTEAIRPRNGKIIDACTNCKNMFSESFK